jgi:drug/metabolite transporter (DMT)-like permease
MADRKTIRSSAILLLTSLIWGLAFVAQRSGMEFIGPFLFVSLRMAFGAATLAIVLFLMNHLRKSRKTDAAVVAGRDNSGAGAGGGALVAGGGAGVGVGENDVALSGKNSSLRGKRLIVAGVFCGAVLFASSSFQQIGLVDIDAGKAGFLTALYIVLVPILGIVLRHRTHWNAWVSVAIAVVGLYFLCIKQGQAIQAGDLITLVGAFGWACHILVIDHFVTGISRDSVLKLCVAQFLVAGLLALLAVPLFDGIFVQYNLEIEVLMNAAPSFLYVGILSTGVAFTLQAVGQQGLSPTTASLIMSLESVFAVVGGMLLLNEAMSAREFVGCGLMFAAVILSQLPIGEKRVQM